MNNSNFSVAVTGLRRHKLRFSKENYGKNEDKIKSSIKNILIPYINDGYNTFLTGMATGSDMMFAKAVIELKENYDIILEAVIPFLEQSNRLSKPDTLEYHLVLKNCDVVRIINNEYSKDAYDKRNDYLVRNASVLLAITNNVKTVRSGTTSTINKATKEGLEIIVLDPYSLEIEKR